MHLPTFFNYVRRSPFGGRLSKAQVAGMESLLDTWAEMGDGDDRKLAYIFATDFRETGGRMQPVREGFASTDAKARRVVRNRRYGVPMGPWGHVYYGRGDVQLTWYENYVRMGRILGIPLAKNPDMALETRYSKRILIEGMMRGKSNKGDFTGKSLEDYFNDTTEDPTGARRIVNGTDKAKLIATYYDAFLDSIEAARAVEHGAREPDAETVKDVVGSVNPVKDLTSIGAAVTAVGTTISGVMSQVEQVDNVYTLVAFGAVAVGVVLVATGRLKLNFETGQ